MKITDLKCAVIGRNPIVRVVTDAGISGYGEVEAYKPYLKPYVLAFREALIGEDPTDVERVMLKIRQRGSFKPWGSAISAIEHALWDIAGKAAGVPVYKLLGGKVRDRVRIYNGAVRFPMKGYAPEDYAEDVRRMKAAKEGFTIVKEGIAFHSEMKRAVPEFYYGEPTPSPFHGALDRGPITEKGLKHVIACVQAMKEVLGDEIGLALDCGPGFMVSDAIRLARALEPMNLMWLEDMITGDYVPYVNADLYREVTRSTTTPIHTGEQIYLRQNYKELIERHAVRIVGPDPCDVGGLAELKWIAEYADLHGILIAPHGVGNGLLGLAALVQVSRDAALQFHRLRISGRRPGLVVRHRRRPARADRQERPDRGVGPPGDGRRADSGKGPALSHRRGRGLLRLTAFSPEDELHGAERFLAFLAAFAVGACLSEAAIVAEQIDAIGARNGEDRLRPQVAEVDILELLRPFAPSAGPTVDRETVALGCRPGDDDVVRPDALEAPDAAAVEIELDRIAEPRLPPLDHLLRVLERHGQRLAVAKRTAESDEEPSLAPCGEAFDIEATLGVGSKLRGAGKIVSGELPLDHQGVDEAFVVLAGPFEARSGLRRPDPRCKEPRAGFWAFAAGAHSM